jgi:hypothetical protein
MPVCIPSRPETFRSASPSVRALRQAPDQSFAFVEAPAQACNALGIGFGSEPLLGFAPQFGKGVGHLFGPYLVQS